MTIQRNDDRFSRVSDEYEYDQEYEIITEDSIRWDFDAGRLGPEGQQSSTTSFNTWSDASSSSSLEESSIVIGGEAVVVAGREIHSIQDLQRHLLEIFQSRYPRRRADDVHRRRTRAHVARIDNDVVFAHDSMVLNRQRTGLMRQTVSTQRWNLTEDGLPTENQVIVSGMNGSLADGDPFMEDSMKLTRVRMNNRENYHQSAELQIISNESEHHSAACSPSP